MSAPIAIRYVRENVSFIFFTRRYGLRWDWLRLEPLIVAMLPQEDPTSSALCLHSFGPCLFRLMDAIWNIELTFGNFLEILLVACVLVLSFNDWILGAIVVFMFGGVFLLRDLKVRAGWGLRRQQL